MSCATVLAISCLVSFLTTLSPLYLNDTLNKDTWRHHVLWRDIAQLNNAVYLGDSNCSGRGHDRRKITSCITIGQIAPGIRRLSFDERHIAFQWVYEHVADAVYDTNLFAFSQGRAIRGWRVKRPHSCTRCAHAFCHGPLRYAFQFDLARMVGLGKCDSIRIQLVRRACK